jgi:hypothetical protein
MWQPRRIGHRSALHSGTRAGLDHNIDSPGASLLLFLSVGLSFFYNKTTLRLNVQNLHSVMSSVEQSTCSAPPVFPFLLRLLCVAQPKCKCGIWESELKPASSLQEGRDVQLVR